MATMLELLADIRRTQTQTIERLADDRHHVLQFGTQADKLRHRISRLESAVADDPTNAQIAGFRRDVKEFMADVAGLRRRIDELATMTSGVETDMTHIKTTLDTLQTRLEERDL